MTDTTPSMPVVRMVPLWFLGLVAAAIVLWFAIEARAFLVPLATAILLFTLMTAAIDRITDLRIGRQAVPVWLAHLTGISLVVIGIAMVVAVLSGQAEEVNAAIPRYVERLQQLLAAAVALVGDGVAARVEDGLSQIHLTRSASGLMGSAGSVLTGIGLVVLYVAFLFGDRSAFKSKIEQLYPSEDEARNARQLILTITTRVRKYIWIKTAASVAIGALTYAVLKPLGVDFAETWALLAFLLNYIPTIGSFLGVALPALVALVQFDTVMPFLIVVLGAGTAQLIIGNIVEPMMMGRSLNLSSFAIILSLTFWGALWGIMGMFLSVPITVVIMIICTHVPSLRWVAVLLSSDGKLANQQPAAP